MKILIRSTLFIASALFACTTQAATYHTDQQYFGDFTITDLGDGNALTSNVLHPTVLVSGDLPMVASTLYSFIPHTMTEAGLTLCTLTCTFTQAMANGDSFSGTLSFDSFDLNGTILTYSGHSVITGGTGFFAGASGGGTMTGRHDFMSYTYGRIANESILTIYTAPVPEPGNNAMLLAGIGILGLLARRRRAID